jgi:hypothetical protein
MESDEPNLRQPYKEMLEPHCAAVRQLIAEPKVR